jgi:UDP-glucuronate decarboxylase
MRIMVTGATGFIGSHFVRHAVRSGAEVTVLSRPGADASRIADVMARVRFVEWDLFAKDQPIGVTGKAPDVCVHLAWYAVPGRYLQAAENAQCVAGSKHLIQEMARLGCKRLLGVGTCFEYATSAKALREGDPLAPKSVYARAKVELTDWAAEYCAHHGMSFSWARLFYQYGPWEDERRLVPAVIRKLMAGETFQPTDPALRRDYMHIEDVASALGSIARSKLEGPVNVGSGAAVSIGEIATTIGQLLGKAELVRTRQPGTATDEPALIEADNSKLRMATGWLQKWDLREGLADAVRWWQGRRS